MTLLENPSIGPIWRLTMLHAFVQPATPPYQPLPSSPSAESETKFKGTLVHEAQLNYFYISPGGKKPQRGIENRRPKLKMTLEFDNLEFVNLEMDS